MSYQRIIKALGVALLVSVQTFAQTSTCIIGTGTSGLSPDGKKGYETAIDNPAAIAIDNSGNIFFADKTHSIIRKLDAATGLVTTIAGNGTFGNSGNGIPATDASLDRPGGLVLDNEGNLYISDQGNNKIRCVNRDGIISDFAGNGIDGYRGDGQKAINASFSEPAGMAFDKSGVLYVADANNNCIRAIDKNGIIRTIAGTPQSTTRFSGDGGKAKMACLNHPSSIAFDHSGIMFFTDCFNHRIRKINKEGIINTVAGNGNEGNTTFDVPAQKSALSFPVGLALSPDGSIFFTESGNNSIDKISQRGILSAVQVNDDKLKAKSPGAIALSQNGELIVCDRDNFRILSIGQIIEKPNEPTNRAIRTKPTGDTTGLSTN